MGWACRTTNPNGIPHFSAFRMNLFMIQIVINITMIDINSQYILIIDLQTFFMENSQLLNHSSAAVQASSPSKIAFKYLNAIQKNKTQQSYMPFLFRAKRTDLVDHTPNPPPGQYQHRSMFEQKSERDQLQQKYRLTMQNSKKIKQSVVFKSTAKRFDYKQAVDYTPISYSNGKIIVNKSRSEGKKQKFRRVTSKTMGNINPKQVCPSIPNKNIKFGYSAGVEGKLKKIEKSQDQLNIEKEDMKKYVKKLNGQKMYESLSPSLHHSRKESKFCLLSKLKNRVNQALNRDSQNNKGQRQSERSSIMMKKPILASNSKCNQNKIYKIRQQKDDSVKKLGPGCYEVSAKGFGQLLKPQKFQFFNSTSERFKNFTVQKQNPPNKSVKMMQINHKLFELQKTKSTNFRRGLKKPIRSSDKSDLSQNQCKEPGPGDYNPNPNSIKSKVGKSSVFEKSPRFDYQKTIKDDKYIQNIDQQNQRIRLGKESYQKQQNKQNANKSYSYNTVIQKNKEFLRNKKQKIQQSYKRYKTKGLSDYSICSWENRPFSRNQGIGTVFKQSPRNELEAPKI